jgi:glycosyltransferase involved in cell wall biosynthesis
MRAQLDQQPRTLALVPPVGRPLHRKRVCVLVPAHWEAVMGGAQYQAKLIVDHLVAAGEYEVFYVAKQTNPEFQPVGYEIRTIGGSMRMRYALDSRRLLKILEEIRPDTIYHQVGGAYTGVAAYYCSRSNCELLWHIASDVDVIPSKPRLREPFKYLDKKMLEYGLRRADRIVAQTEDQAAFLEQHYGLGVTRIVRNFHPVPTEAIVKEPPVEVLWVANLKRVKQPEVFVRLAGDLAGSGARFTMIGGLQGDPAWRAGVVEMIKATPNLDYLGALPQEEVNARFARAHILVNTSVYEGFSNTFIQAWMREVPVVSLNVNPEGSFDDARLGFCAGGDYPNLVQQLETLIQCDALREEIGLRARDHAHEQFGYRNIEALVALI